MLRSRLLRWLAVLAFTVQALMPAAVLALGTSGGTGGTAVELCTASGTRWIHVDDGPGGQPAPKSGMAGDHCPLCSSAAGLAVPAMLVRIALPIATTIRILDATPASRHRSRAPPHDAPPRAPPSA